MAHLQLASTLTKSIWGRQGTIKIIHLNVSGGQRFSPTTSSAAQGFFRAAFMCSQQDKTFAGLSRQWAFRNPSLAIFDMFYVSRQTSITIVVLLLLGDGKHGTRSPHQSRRLSFMKLCDSKEILVLEKVRGWWLLTFSLFIYWNLYRIIQWKLRRRLLLQCCDVNGGLEGNSKEAAATLRQKKITNFLHPALFSLRKYSSHVMLSNVFYFNVSANKILNLRFR